MCPDICVTHVLPQEPPPISSAFKFVLIIRIFQNTTILICITVHLDKQVRQIFVIPFGSSSLELTQLNKQLVQGKIDQVGG